MDHEQPDHRLAAPHSPDGDDVYQDLRPLLLSTAYRMVGSYREAEDLVQEAFVRFHEATQRGRLAERFFAASQRGDLAALVEMLARDAVFVGDGGGKGNGLARPAEGRERVGRLLVSFTGRAMAMAITLRPIHVGGQPAVLLLDADDQVVAVWSLHVVDGLVTEVHGIVNPDKLAHLGPVSPFAYRRQPRDPTRSIEQQEGHEDDHS